MRPDVAPGPRFPCTLPRSHVTISGSRTRRALARHPERPPGELEEDILMSGTPHAIAPSRCTRLAAPLAARIHDRRVDGRDDDHWHADVDVIPGGPSRTGRRPKDRLRGQSPQPGSGRFRSMSRDSERQMFPTGGWGSRWIGNPNLSGQFNRAAGPFRFFPTWSRRVFTTWGLAMLMTEFNVANV